MIINAIRYRSAANAEWQTVRFVGGSGACRSMACITADSSELEAISKALELTLTGKTQSQVAEATVQLSLDSGETWIVQRSVDRVLVSRNGKRLAMSSKDALDLFWQAIGLAEGEGDNSQPLNFYELGTTRSSARLLESDAARSVRENRRVITRQITDLARECAQKWQCEALSKPKQLIRLARNLEPLQREFLEIDKQLATLTKDIEDQRSQQMREITPLRERVVLLARISSALEPFQTGFTPAREKLAKIDEQIDLLRHRCRSSADSADEIRRDWRQPIEALSRVEVYTKLIRAVQGARRFCQQNVEPHLDSFFDAIKSLDSERTIAAEIQSCLESIHIQLGGPRITSHQDQNSSTNLRNWFEKFKTKASEEIASEAATNTLKSTPQNFENLRLSLEFTLQQLDELKKRVEDKRQASPSDRLETMYEEMVRGLTRHREHWQRIAGEFGLPEELSLKQLLQIIADFSQLSSLLQTRSAALAEECKQSEALAHLGGLVEAWKKMTESQTQVDIRDPKFVIAEARSIVRYLDAQATKLEDIDRQSIEADVLAKVYARLCDQKAKVESRWTRTFAEHGIEPWPIHDKDQSQLYQRAQIIRALALVHSSLTPLDGDHDSISPLRRGIIVIRCDALDAKRAIRKTLREIAGRQSDSEAAILFLLSDESAGQELINQGVGQGISVGADEKRGTVVVGQKPRSAPSELARRKAELDKRARAAIELLTRKPNPAERQR